MKRMTLNGWENRGMGKVGGGKIIINNEKHEE